MVVAEGYMSLRDAVAWRRAKRSGPGVLVVRSPAHAERQVAGLAKRLATAGARGSDPSPRSGNVRSPKGQLVAASTRCSRNSRPGVLQVEWQREIERHTTVGRGTRLGNASTAGNEHSRYHLTAHSRAGRPHQSPHATLWLEKLSTKCAARRLVARCHLVLSPRIPDRTYLQPPPEPRAYRAPLFVETQQPNRGPHVPADARRRVLTIMGCSSAVSAERSRHTPRLAPENKTKMTDTPTAEPESCKRLRPFR